VQEHGRDFDGVVVKAARRLREGEAMPRQHWPNRFGDGFQARIAMLEMRIGFVRAALRKSRAAANASASFAMSGVCSIIAAPPNGCHSRFHGRHERTLFLVIM
jgi:hypothetical protein